MKKISSIIVMLALAFALTVTVSADSGYSFTKTLKLGSRGADVSALQTVLVSKGLLTMPAGVAMGYYGSLTVSAVKAYQASKGISTVGQVGPATRAALNAEGAVVSTNVAGCVAGALFSSVTGQPCTTTSTGGTTSTVGITTPGVAGTLDIARGSAVGNGTTYNDGQSGSIISYDLKAGASDEAVTALSVDFSVRPWLYVSSLSFVNQQTGATIATVSGLTAANFTEITVGSEYRITVPVTGMIVPKGQRVTVIVNATMAGSNRTGPVNVFMTRAEARAVDGTGVTTTSQLLAQTDKFVYGGVSNSALITTLDVSSPQSSIIQTSVSAVTNNVSLAVYSFKSQNIASTLQQIAMKISTATSGAAYAPENVFQNVQLVSGSTVLSNGTFGTSANGSTTVTFNNFNLNLPQDVYVPVKVIASVQKNVSGVTASTSLTVNSTNLVGIDANSNSLTVNSSGTVISSAILQFSASGATLTAPSFSITPPLSNSTGIYKTAIFSGAFTLTAGNNPIYVSRTPATALTATSSNVASSTATLDSIGAGNVLSNDPTGFYQITPGQSRTFSFSGTLTNTSTTTGNVSNATAGITTIYFTDDTGTAQKSSISTGLDALNAYFGVVNSRVTLGTL